jgi:AhpD family alkylhydroperoxidase
MNPAQAFAPAAIEESTLKKSALEEKALKNVGHSMNSLQKVLAHSPSALQAYTDLETLNQQGNLDRLTKQRIALTLAQLNDCTYSVSHHTRQAREAGLNSSEIDSNLAGTSQDAKGAVAVQFARTLATHKGNVNPQQWQEIRQAGYNDSDIVEIIAHVGMNILGNLFGKACNLQNDFPKVE